MLFMERRYLTLCLLTHGNLAVPNWSSKTKQRVMLIGCVIPMVFAYRVGFGVARSYDQGDARASMCGTSNRSDSHAFLYISQTIY